MKSNEGISVRRKLSQLTFARLKRFTIAYILNEPSLHK